MRKLSLLLFSIVLSYSALAQEEIVFRWLYYWDYIPDENNFTIRATEGEEFIIEWYIEGKNVFVYEIQTFIGTDENMVIECPWDDSYIDAEGTALIQTSSENCQFTHFITNSNFCVLSLIHCKSLIYLDFSNMNQYTGLVFDIGLSDCTSLQTLICRNINYRYDIDLNSCTELTYLDFSSSKIGNIDFTNCKKLKYLDCSNSFELRKIDLSNCTELTYLDCSNNILGELVLSNCTELIYLYCRNNPLSELDLSDCTKLSYLDCSKNYLRNLNINNCISLKYFNCSDNSLRSNSIFDLSNYTELKYFNCSNNYISFLDISNNLDTIICYENYLSLHNLFTISEKVTEQNNKLLGLQGMPSQKVNIGDTLFSEISVINGIFTRYSVRINNGCEPAPYTDYSVVDGKLIFHKVNIYSVWGFNDAIISNSNYPACVYTIVTVEGVNTDDLAQSNKIQVYPNPTTGQITIYNEQLTIKNVEIFDVSGRYLTPVPSPKWRGVSEGRGEVVIDISNLETGIYYLRIDNQIVKIVKN